MDMDLAGTVLEGLILLKKPLERWNLKWVKQIKQTPYSEIHLVKDFISSLYILRVTENDRQQGNLWTDLSDCQLPYISRILAVCTEVGKCYSLEAYYCGRSLKEANLCNLMPHHEDICLTGIHIAKDLKILFQQKGILHMDIKPDNILIDAYGNVRLIDFGAAISRIDQQNMLQRPQWGTPSYMAPERYSEPNETGPFSDLYSLALTLKYIMTVSGNRHFGLWQFLSEWCEGLGEVAFKVPEQADLYDLFTQGLWEQLTT